MANIEKSLKPKYHPSKKEIKELLPKQYKRYINIFNLNKANKLPLHKPGIDYRIKLKPNKNSKEKKVPWGALYNISHNKLLVLKKT